MKDYDEMLKAAPEHDTDAFIDYLRNENVVVSEDGTWLIIENCKYHSSERPWYTIFFKCRHFPHCSCSGGVFQYLDEEYGDWEWLKKSAERQTIQRFHIHIYKTT